MAYCSNCGKEITDGVRYCPDCGAPVSQQRNLELPEKNQKNYGRPGPLPGIIALVLGFFSFGIQSRGIAVLMSLAALVIGIYSLVRKGKLRGFAIAAIVLAVLNFVAGPGTSTVGQEPRTQTSSETKSSGSGSGTGTKKAPPAATKPAENTDAARDTEADSKVASNQGVDPELKDFLDSYEAFVDEYVVFMQQYSKNPSDLSLLAKYADIMQKYSDFAVKVEKYDTKTMSTEDAAYYIEVTSRCSQKMLKVLDSGKN